MRELDDRSQSAFPVPKFCFPGDLRVGDFAVIFGLRDLCQFSTKLILIDNALMFEVLLIMLLMDESIVESYVAP